MRSEGWWHGRPCREARTGSSAGRTQQGTECDLLGSLARGSLIYSFTRGQIGGIISPMPVLTRRRDQDRRDECWLIFFGDVHVGTIGIAARRTSSLRFD
jgi:hypothetical protein